MLDTRSILSDKILRSYSRPPPPSRHHCRFHTDSKVLQHCPACALGPCQPLSRNIKAAVCGPCYTNTSTISFCATPPDSSLTIQRLIAFRGLDSASATVVDRYLKKSLRPVTLRRYDSHTGENLRHPPRDGLSTIRRVLPRLHSSTRSPSWRSPQESVKSKQIWVSGGGGKHFISNECVADFSFPVLQRR